MLILSMSHAIYNYHQEGHDIVGEPKLHLNE